MDFLFVVNAFRVNFIRFYINSAVNCFWRQKCLVCPESWQLICVADRATDECVCIRKEYTYSRGIGNMSIIGLACNNSKSEKGIAPNDRNSSNAGGSPLSFTCHWVICNQLTEGLFLVQEGGRLSSQPAMRFPREQFSEAKKFSSSHLSLVFSILFKLKLSMS